MGLGQNSVFSYLYNIIPTNIPAISEKISLYRISDETYILLHKLDPFYNRNYVEFRKNALTRYLHREAKNGNIVQYVITEISE